jgi:hypothetical protein
MFSSMISAKSTTKRAGFSFNPSFIEKLESYASEHGGFPLCLKEEELSELMVFCGMRGVHLPEFFKTLNGCEYVCSLESLKGSDFFCTVQRKSIEELGSSHLRKKPKTAAEDGDVFERPPASGKKKRGPRTAEATIQFKTKFETHLCSIRPGISVPCSLSETEFMFLASKCCPHSNPEKKDNQEMAFRRQLNQYGFTCSRKGNQYNIGLKESCSVGSFSLNPGISDIKSPLVLPVYASIPSAAAPMLPPVPEPAPELADGGGLHPPVSGGDADRMLPLFGGEWFNEDADFFGNLHSGQDFSDIVDGVLGHDPSTRNTHG